MFEPELKMGREQQTHVAEFDACNIGTYEELGDEKDRKKALRRIFQNPIDKFKYNTGQQITKLNVLISKSGSKMVQRINFIKQTPLNAYTITHFNRGSTYNHHNLVPAVNDQGIAN